jgi:large subunit ribosomal protein L24
MKYKVGDNVKIIAGDQKGSSGKIIKIYRAKNKALVEGINIVKKHNKPNANNPKGGIVEKESPVHISNISFVTKDGNTTRVGYKVEDGKKVRISTKTKEII